MNKKILLVLGVIFSTHYTLANSQSYGPIIQRQSKQIQALKSRILELENTIEEIRINLKTNEVITKQSAKAADTLLKLAYSLVSLNKNKEMYNMLEKLELEFPRRPISSIKRANETKNTFHCNNFN